MGENTVARLMVDLGLVGRAPKARRRSLTRAGKRRAAPDRVRRQFTAVAPNLRACRRLGIYQSMGRPGSALDNAAIEAWHSTLEFELHSRESFATKAIARTGVASWIDEYNRERRHSALGMQSPITFELAHAQPTPPRRAA